LYALNTWLGLLLHELLAKEKPIIVPEKTEEINEGSCVTIPCAYKKLKDETCTLLWFKDPKYDDVSKMFIGTIVYSNIEERPQSPAYSSRVEYITDATSLKQQKHQNDHWIKCDLRITDLQKTDSGNYGFRVINSEKFMSETLTLTVTDNPCKVHTEPSELKNPLQESEEFTVRCSTFGSCNFHPEWLIYTSGQKQEWMSSSSLTEHYSQQLSSSLFLFLDAPKETKATVSSENVKEGDSVTLSCTSTGRPDVSFKWFKKEKTEKAQQMSDLTLISVKPEDSGEYYCEAENKHGAKESNIIQIDKVSQCNLWSALKISEGDKLALKCLVQKSNPTVYKFTWYKNSQVQSETSETFIISKVTAEDKGSYQCRADNGIKTATSDDLWVSVMRKYYIICSTLYYLCVPSTNKCLVLYILTKTCINILLYCTKCDALLNFSFSVLTDSPRNIKIKGVASVKVGTPLTLTCSADSDPPPHMYTWKHKPGLSSVPLSMETGQLNIKKMTIQHAGQYTCDVTNTIGTGSHTIKVDVLYALKNVSVSSKGEQTFGSELTLTCEAHSKPAPSSYEWKKRFNGQLKTVGHEQILHFYFLEITDSGQYVCIAHNSIGKTESPSVEIKVKCEYSFLLVTHFNAPNINIVHNMTIFTQWNWKLSVYLTCSADAYPPATDYKWFKQGDKTKVVSQQQNFTVWPQNPGMYYCTAANAIGKSRSEHIMLFIGSEYEMAFIK
uniref:B-cell receptor CD22 n=1 Tax=Sinocyclocheilus rhinocerous TaxID=307959 RepID=A0A673LVW8_9TELE